jgi:diadenosine tetraphosphate (Ap4A) HIT family hydrolase
MNATLDRFNYPSSIIRNYTHWVVMVRPGQVTLGCTIIASKSDCTSLGDLLPEQAAELPQVISEFERTLRRLLPVSKFNYLALMMVDPNPHFHAIPRYAREVVFAGTMFSDSAFPKIPDLTAAHDLTTQQFEEIRRWLNDNWVT